MRQGIRKKSEKNDNGEAAATAGTLGAEDRFRENEDVARSLRSSLACARARPASYADNSRNRLAISGPFPSSSCLKNTNASCQPASRTRLTHACSSASP